MSGWKGIVLFDSGFLKQTRTCCCYFVLKGSLCGYGLHIDSRDIDLICCRSYIEYSYFED